MENAMTFDPTQNRIPTRLLTADELAQLKAHGGPYERFGNYGWTKCEPIWFPDYTYRAKPKPAPTITINGIEVPEPVREPLQDGQRYYVVTLSGDGVVWNYTWHNSSLNHDWLRRGLLHLTREAAEAHARALIAASGGVV